MPQSSFSTSLDGGSYAAEGAGGFQDAIDQALELLQTEWRRIAMRVYPEYAFPIEREQLRDGPIARDLRRLAAVARGNEMADPGDVQRAVDAVLQLLYWPAGAHAFQVPDRFWQTELGSMLAQAMARSRHAVRASRFGRITGGDTAESPVPDRDDRSSTGTLSNLDQPFTDPNRGQQGGQAEG